MTSPAGRAAIDDRTIHAVVDQLREGGQVRHSLPADGRLNIDRPLPFIIVYRPPVDRADAGTRHFVRSEASYAIAPHDRRSRPKVRELALNVVRTLSDTFDGFLVVEIWSGPDANGRVDDEVNGPPGFRVVTPRRFAESSTVERLVRSLGRITLFKQQAEVELAPGSRLAPTGMSPLLDASEMHALGAMAVGIEVRPVYRNPGTGEEYPIARRRLARQLSRALRETCFEFARSETNARPRHYQALGARAFNKSAWRVDAALADVAREFDLLLYVTPTNAHLAFDEFKSSRHERAPTFQYRPRDFDPGALKRRLHDIDIDRVEDPTLAHIFREKKGELDLQLSLLMERESDRFLPLSQALYGRTSSDLLATANGLLGQLHGDGSRRSRVIPAKRFVTEAQRELDNYKRTYPPFSTRIEVREDISSLMVSHGNLLVGKGMSFDSARVQPLLQHEVGTHVVTHWNGLAQPFQLLSVGLANYDELQEGLAVFAEYLAGGLTVVRMRTLAARVVAVDALVRGADFVEVYRLLCDEHGLSEHISWQVTMRVFRGGGFVKDCVYLRGVQAVLDYLSDGGHLETLMVGKVASEHAAVVEELQRRQVLNPPPLRPAYLDDPDSQARLDKARSGIYLVDLVDR